MAEYHADLGRDTREYATVYIEAETADAAAIQLRDALKADKAGDYPELFADLHWRADGDSGDIDLIDRLIDSAQDCYAEYSEEIDIEGPRPPAPNVALRIAAELLEHIAQGDGLPSILQAAAKAALKCRQALGEAAPDGA